MNEAEKTTSTRPQGAKPIDPRMLALSDRFSRVRNMVALARVSAHVVASDGCEEAAAGLGWVMHLAQEEADGALADLDAIMGRAGA